MAKKDALVGVEWWRNVVCLPERSAPNDQAIAMWLTGLVLLTFTRIGSLLVTSPAPVR